MTEESVKTGLVRREFNAVQEVGSAVEVATTAAAAHAKAMVEARYVMAIKHRRRWDIVRQDLLEECARPAFAMDKSALYNKPIGRNGVEGLGIRFAEVAIRCMGNIMTNSMVIQEDDLKRTIHVEVLDLESNNSHGKDVQVTKTVERSNPLDDGSYISVRMNSRGNPVYSVPATDDDLLNKEASLISKALRTQTLRLIPGDVQEQCENKIREIRAAKVKADPDGEKRSIIDAFARQRVKVLDLEAFLEHSIDLITPDEIVNLRGLYGAIADGETTWKAVMENLEESRKLKPKTKTAADEPKRGVEAVKAKMEEQKQQQPQTTKPRAAAAASAPSGTAASASVVAAQSQSISSVEDVVEVAKEELKAFVTLPSPEEPALMEEEELLEQEEADELQEPPRPPIRGVQFPNRLTRRPNEPEPDQAVVDECLAEAARLGQNIRKLAPKWLNAPFDDLTEASMRALATVLKNINTPPKKQQ